MIRYLLLMTLSLVSVRAWSYHHFIFKNYASCMTCHYQPNGGGPLNDYGRALWATEFTARWLIPAKVTDENMSNTSSFFIFSDRPLWLRPHIKWRGIELENSPGSEASQKRFLPMQREAGLVLITNEDKQNALITNFTFNDNMSRFVTSQEVGSIAPQWRARDFYYRQSIKDNSWLLLGQFDKPFGIRDVNHMLFSRRLNRLTQYDQSLGGMIFAGQDQWEWSGMGFLGNINESEQLRLKGLSTLYEYQWTEGMRWGGSLLTQKNDFMEQFSFALHVRRKVGSAASLAFEMGSVNISDFINSTKNNTQYILIQQLISLTRGLNWHIDLEWQKDDKNLDNSFRQRANFGLLAFPIPRLEYRLMWVNEKTIHFNKGQADAWVLQNQIHWSL